MAEVTTIQVPKKVLAELRSIKEYPRQSYSELLSKMVKVFKQARKHGQYDEFLHRIQQYKMRELWDNKYDEVWDHV